jgi:hypothetical protein
VITVLVYGEVLGLVRSIDKKLFESSLAVKPCFVIRRVVRAFYPRPCQRLFTLDITGHCRVSGLLRRGEGCAFNQTFVLTCHFCKPADDGVLICLRQKFEIVSEYHDLRALSAKRKKRHPSDRWRLQRLSFAFGVLGCK